ncbi:hypothetical protein HWC21_gp002 [Vibrio phage VAP7]|uniref:Uncharacterized protein n=1 Tax=Vibrio phage VAP7 TaxID=2584487 RepID=A0A4Y5TUZ8_9CAUD|nr:hypothetical protein HWC21_gp002 [Vibrio phage VAP7]QDB73184.1 hypothetical protein [Vibrio phage VAP7]
MSLASFVNFFKKETAKTTYDAEIMVAPFPGLTMFKILLNGVPTLVASKNVNVEEFNYKRQLQVKFDMNDVVDKIKNYKEIGEPVMDVLLLRSIDKVVF